MPGKSDFEFLSVVRRRFPQVSVIAMSGEYDGLRPVGLLANAFFIKAHYKPEELFIKITELIKASPPRAHPAKSDYAPIWFPRSTNRYFVLTCTDCLRSFSVSSENTRDDEVCETDCTFCGITIRYLVERSESRKKR